MSTPGPLKIAITGSGYGGGGVAPVLAIAGHPVQIAYVSAEIAQRNHERLLVATTRFVEDGLMTDDAVNLVQKNVSVAASLEAAVRGADVFEEAVPERLDLKRAALAAISAAASPDAVIGTTPSTILIASLADAVRHLERFLGVHFTNPAPFILRVELILHQGTNQRSIELVESLSRDEGKSTARVSDSTGFVLNRLQDALFHEAAQLVGQGIATPDDIDTILRSAFGFQLQFFGPFANVDTAGLDVFAFCYESLQTAYPERFATPRVLSELVQQGKLGVTSEAGFCSYDTSSAAELAAYRNRGYAEMQALFDRLGRPPANG